MQMGNCLGNLLALVLGIAWWTIKVAEQSSRFCAACSVEIFQSSFNCSSTFTFLQNVLFFQKLSRIWLYLYRYARAPSLISSLPAVTEGMKDSSHSEKASFLWNPHSAEQRSKTEVLCNERAREEEKLLIVCKAEKVRGNVFCLWGL